MNKWARVLFSLLFLLPVSGAFAGMAHRVDSDAFRQLSVERAKGDRLRVELALADRPLALEVERFEVFRPDAKIAVYGDNDQLIETLAAPAQQYYQGRVAGDPDSMVFLSAGANGRYEGLILTETRRYEIRSAPRSRVGTNAVRSGDSDVFVMESPLDEDFSGMDGFTCDIEKTGRTMGRFGALLQSLDKNQVSEGSLSGSANTLWQLNMAIETDYELFVNAGSSSSNVTTFIGNLVAAASTIYKRDLKTELYLSYLGIHTTVSDPFAVNPGSSGSWDGAPTTYSTLHALLELGDRWHNSAPYSGARSSTVLISGKSQLAGIAWIETMCQGDFSYGGHWGGRYAYCGGIDPPADNSVPNPEGIVNNVAPASNYWPLLEFTHELGHNVGSNHTHCITLSASEQTTYGRTFVDNCYNGESGNGCYGGANTVPTEKGTIMSYCHLLGGGSQTRFIFGKGGEASSHMLTLMQNYFQTYTPTLSTITAPASVSSGVASNASVTSMAGVTYQWTITNGTINGSSTSATVNFTGTTNPVKLKVTATNTGGCSVTDFANVTVNTVSCSYSINPTSRSHGKAATTGQTLAVTAGSGCAWTAVSNSAFITITGGANGTGNGTVTYSLAANATGMSRMGTITVAGQTFTVTQSALGASAHTDFNGDGYADLFFRSGTTGANVPWLMNGSTVASSTAAGPLATNWSVGGIGDFDADGRADILWRSPNTSEAAIWFMNGSTALSGAYLPSVSSQWVIQGVGDFSGDGKADILWRNSSTYEAVVWRMNGATIAESATIAVPGPQWTINGVGDFDGDAKADILWRNTNTSEAVIWLMNGAAIKSANYVASPNAIWTVKGVGDFNGDGMTDIFWVNTSNQTVVWLMNGLSILSSGYSATPPAGWAAQGVGDYDGDGKADLMWRNTSNGQNALWFMNGINVASGVYITTLADTSYNCAGPR